MKAITTKRMVFSRLAYVSRLAGESYDADYKNECGGWCMYLAGTDGFTRGRYGFDCRMPTREFFAYLYGLEVALMNCAAR